VRVRAAGRGVKDRGVGADIFDFGFAWGAIGEVVAGDEAGAGRDGYGKAEGGQLGSCERYQDYERE
jgi:hypothetical protein